MKKYLSLFLILCLLLGLVACGGDKGEASDDPNLGLYEAYTAEMWGIEMSVADIYEKGFTVELKAKGKCALEVDGKKANGKWSLEGENIHIKGGGVEMDGVLKDGVITVEDLMGMGLTMTFKNMSYAPSVVFAPPVLPDTVPNQGDTNTTVPAVEPVIDNRTPAQKYWVGDWYGWWLITGAGGQYSGMDDGTHWYDACATIELDEAGNGVLTIWDEDCEADTCIAEVNIAISDGGFEQGRIKSVSGRFYDMELGNADWLVDPGTEEDPIITIEGSYRNPSEWFDNISFDIYLAPWGYDWVNATIDPPGTYEDWYLPLIQAGKAMPDSIGGEATEDMATVPGNQGAAAPGGTEPVSQGSYSFSGPTATLDFRDGGELFITYDSSLFTYDPQWHNLDAADDLRVSIMWHWDESSVKGRLERMENFSTAEGYSYKTMKIAGYDAYRMTYIDADFGDYYTETLIVFGDAYKKAAVTFFASSPESFEKTQCSDVEAILYNVQPVAK